MSTASRPVRANHLKWTQAHFNLKISVDLVGKGKQAVSWGKTQPIVSGLSQVQAQHTATREKGSCQPMIVLPRQSRVGNEDDNRRYTVWETGEGLRTREEVEGEIPSSGEGLSCPYTAATKPNYHVSVADSLDAEPGAHGTNVQL